MRLHLFEWEDMPWYPDTIRRSQTDYLRFLMETFDVFRAVIPQLSAAWQASKEETLVDFCSGGGGSLLIIQDHLLRQGLSVPMQGSDLYPNTDAFRHVEARSQAKITFRDKPLDVRDIPEDVHSGFWTIFNGFHHLRPHEARGFLGEAVARRRPVGIFEPIDKSPLQLIINTLALTVLMWVVTPFLRPFRWSRLVFTYLIPLLPFFTLWDGWVSVFRLYGPAALRGMIAAIPDHEHYTWQVGKARHQFGTVIYLIGLPKVG
ncbi:MAG: class I SAM-dependent methyltransferase [Bernardetiaceae bacterium]